jgi:hypothetical protein
MMGKWQTLKVPMITDSRKAQRNSSAHHRANLLFSGLPQRGTSRGERAPRLVDAELSSLTQLVRTGLIGFVPKSAIAPLDTETVSHA